MGSFGTNEINSSTNSTLKDEKLSTTGRSLEAAQQKNSLKLHVLPCSRFDPNELADLLMCFVFVLKHVPEGEFSEFMRTIL